FALVFAAPAFAQTASSGTATSSAPSFAFCPSLTTQLVVGSRDATTKGQVTELQLFLNRRYSNQLITGYYGSITRANVLRYQQEQGISAVGVVGPLTRAAIWRG